MANYQQGVPIEISDTFTVDGVETNPTTVTWTFLGPDGVTTVYTNASPEVTNPSVGNFVLSLAPPGNPGFYSYDVDATGAVVASRSGSFYVIPNAAIPDLDVNWAVLGPCTPWASSQDVWNCCGQPMTTIGEGSSEEECPVDMSSFAFSASQLLFELSGRRWAGQCSKTVVACEDTCTCGIQVLSRGYVVNSWNGYPAVYQGACGCPTTVKLSGYPVREITEVVIDGVTLDPSDYKLYDRRKLARVDGGKWPSCDDICRASSEDENTITYSYGQDPPLAGIAAAAQLGCELYRACGGAGTGGDCALPTGVTRTVRQGITIERLAFTSWAFNQGTWRTGMALVDAFLGAYAKTGMIRRPTFWSPSRAARYAQSVGQ